MKRLLVLILIILVGCSINTNGADSSQEEIEKVNNLIKDRNYKESYKKIKELNLDLKHVDSSGFDYEEYVTLYEINSYIEDEKFEDAAKLIVQNDIANKKLLYEIYNYKDVITYSDMLINYSKDVPIAVLSAVNKEYNNMQDEYIKGKVRKLFNKSVDKILKNYKSDPYFATFPIYEELFDGYPLIPSNIRYSEFYSDDSKEKLMNEINPTHPLVESKGLNMIFDEECNSLHKDGGDNIERLLRDRNKEYDFLYDYYSNFLLIEGDSIVVEFDNMEKVKNIFKLTDESGNTLSPSDVLYEEARQRSIVNKKEREESIKEFERERAKEKRKEEEEKRVRIGMNYDEVKNRWGKPNDINTTTTKYGVTEQWVYPNGKYIYFEDGVVTTIRE